MPLLQIHVSNPPECTILRVKLLRLLSWERVTSPPPTPSPRSVGFASLASSRTFSDVFSIPHSHLCVKNHLVMPLSLLESSVRVMHLGLAVCLYAQTLLLRLIRFFSQEVLYPSRSIVPVARSSKMIGIWTQEFIKGFFTISRWD